MSFICEVRGCESPAKVGGKCVKHACEALKKEHGLKPPALPWMPVPPSTDQDEDEENDMSDKTCAACGQPQKEGERLYRDICPECRSKARAERKGKPRKKVPETPSPSMGEGRGEGEDSPFPKGGQRGIITPPPPVASPAAGDIVTKLLEEFYACLNKAKDIHEVLTAIKELTGAEIHIPEINF